MIISRSHRSLVSLNRLTGRERSLRRRQSCDRHAERRATDVIKSDLVAEGNRARLAAVFAADADFKFGLDRAPAFCARAYEFAHAVGVEHLKGVFGHDLVFDVLREEAPR